MSILVAFCANGRYAGKDTAGGFVYEWCAERKLTFESISFARAGKRVIAESFGWKSSHALDLVDEFKTSGEVLLREKPEQSPFRISGRQFTINVLEAIRLVFGPDFWTNVVLPTSWEPNAHVTVITDLRFPPEAARIFGLNGHIVEINRASAEGGQSEGELGEYPLTQIDNDGSLEEFRSAIFAYMDRLNSRYV